MKPDVSIRLLRLWNVRRLNDHARRIANARPWLWQES